MSSIREKVQIETGWFILDNAGLLDGARVLDLGCGKAPYRALIMSCGAEYHGFDRPYYRDSNTDVAVGERSLLGETWDVIVCTAVIQNVDDPAAFLRGMPLRDGGALILTYDTCWCDYGQLWGFTPNGMTSLLESNGFLVHTNKKLITLYMKDKTCLWEENEEDGMVLDFTCGTIALKR